jgi:adenylate cyclase
MLRLRKLPFWPYITAIFVSGTVFLAISGIRSAGYLEYLELMAYDWFIRTQPVNSGSSQSIVVIGITENDIQNQGRWPISDETIAQALDSLLRCEPRTIGLDIFRDLPVPPGSKEFESILEENKNIITVMKFGQDGVPPPKTVRDTNRIGFNDILVDPGGIVRRGLLFLDDGESVYYSLALQLALQYLSYEGIYPQPDASNPQYIALGDTTIPPTGPSEGGYVAADARGYQFFIDFAKAIESFQEISLTSLLSGEIAPDKISDKIVIIGVTAQSVKDFFYTSHSRGFRGRQQVPGVILHAYLTDQLLRFALDDFQPRRSINDRQEILWILLWSLLGGLVALLVRSPLRFSIVGSVNLFILFLITFFVFLKSWWIPIVPPAIAWIISAAIVTVYLSSRERSQRSLLMQLFSKYVSPEVADSIWQQRDDFFNNGRPRPQKLAITVMFSDLKGFTTLSETMNPNALVDWLNMYLAAMVKLVLDHGGIIDDYAGDGIKANFGVPLPRKNRDEISQDAVNAVNCALLMEKEMHKLNELWLKQNLPTTGMRIGIFTGPAVAAALGSSNRLKYTTIGDTVNIAARLESFDKNFARESLCRILIGESTLSYLDDQFETERVGEKVLKGKEQKTTIYRIHGKK